MVESTILSRKMIKPSISTPSSFRRHNLCYFDYIMSPTYVPLVAFYSKPTNNDVVDASQISHSLETSLSKVLASYCPLAGRMVDNKYVDCDDTGAEYFNVQVSCRMSEILNNVCVDVVFPQDLPWTSSLDGTSPLVVQISHFDCGGIAVSVCISHKIVDGYSLFKFLNDWGNTARELNYNPCIKFDAFSLFPLMDDPPPASKMVRNNTQRCVSRMFHFTSSSLNRLKNRVAKNSKVQDPSRIEVATALVHKCGVEASMQNSNFFKPSLLSHVMNVRPKSAINTVGNVVIRFFIQARTEGEIQLPEYVGLLHKAKQDLQQLKEMSADKLVSYSLELIKLGASMPVRDMFDVYSCTSFCNFGFYAIDFGWGKPLRVTQPSYHMKNNFFFIDDPSGDGIDALITLTQAEMSIFQTNKELLEYASLVF